jgi:hypothetical protein
MQRYKFNERRLMKTGFLAQIEMESLANIKVIFSWLATATNGSSLQAKEKTLLWSKLGMKSWIGFYPKK